MTGTYIRAALLMAAGIATVLGGLVLLFFGIFPFVYAESGQHSYIEAHRGEIWLEIITGLGLLYFAWRCFKAVFRSKQP